MLLHSTADYSPYFSLALDNLVLTSIDAIITAHQPPNTPSAGSILAWNVRHQMAAKADQPCKFVVIFTSITTSRVATWLNGKIGSFYL